MELFESNEKEETKLSPATVNFLEILAEIYFLQAKQNVKQACTDYAKELQKIYEKKE